MNETDDITNIDKIIELYIFKITNQCITNDCLELYEDIISIHLILIRERLLTQLETSNEEIFNTDKSNQKKSVRG
jgi:hypothetical protein